MKFKIILLIMAGIMLASLNSCFVRVGGHARPPRIHHERRGHGNRGYVQPLNNELQNSFAAKESLGTVPSKLQPSAQRPANSFTVLYFD